MPFKSKAQQRFMFAAEERGELPKGTAHRWAHETKSIKKLPEKVATHPLLLAHAHDHGSGLARSAIREGAQVELEHTHDPEVARQIAIDHLREKKDYYPLLKKYVEGEKEARVTGRSVNKLLYILDKLEDVDPNTAKNLFDAGKQEHSARKHSSALAKIALSIPGPGEVRKITSASVGRFNGIAGQTPAALRAPGIKSPNVLDPSRSIPNAMKAFK